MNDDTFRDLELILLHNGGAELVDFTSVEDGEGVWASDSDNDFKEKFPDFLNEGDVERVQDYLVEAGLITDDEADNMEISIESLTPETAGAHDEGDGDDWTEY